MISSNKKHLLHKKFTLPKGCSIQTFVMREIDGEDEREAGRWIAARGNVEDSGITLIEEQLKVALVAVNGRKVDAPFQGLEKFSSKTRRFMMEAFGQMNGIEEDEVEDFLGASAQIVEESPPEIGAVQPAQPLAYVVE